MKGLSAEQVTELLDYIQRNTPSYAAVTEAENDCESEYQFQRTLRIQGELIRRKIEELLEVL